MISPHRGLWREDTPAPEIGIFSKKISASIAENRFLIRHTLVMSFFRRCWQAWRLWRVTSRDPRTPQIAKILPWLSILYILWSIDLIPDVISILGQLDDALMIPFLLWLVLQLIPQDEKDAARKNVIDVEPVR